MPPATGRNRWNYEQRVCLHLLWTHERNPSLSERARAFNHIFKQHQAACGISTAGLDQGKLRAQYAELKSSVGKSTWKPTWQDVCQPPDTDEDRALRAKLAAQINGVLQQGESVDVAIDITTPPHTPRRTDRVRKVTQNPYDSYAASDPVTPAQQQTVRHAADMTSNPYATPGPSTRKRPAATPSRHLVEDPHDELVNDDEEYVPRAKRARRSSPRVFVSPPPDELVVQAPRTPQKSRRRPPGVPRTGANMLFTQPSGRELMLKPREHEQASRPLQDVPEEAAHPYPPALLFRYWHDKSHGINSSEGFVSGKFMPKNILVEPRGPPDCDTIDMNDFAHHLNNRTGTDQDGIPSPFISTANNLAWGIRMALKRMNLAAKFSVIDPSKLDPKAIYYVPPFYESLKKKRCFERGYFGYRGTHEHMVYHKIPRSAMVKTFSIQELIAFSKSDKDVKRVLRLELMAVAKTPSADIIKALKHDNLTVNSRVASAIGKIVIFLGLDHRSTREMLSRAVFEIVQGWALRADGESQEKAGCFIKQFQDRSNEYIGLKDQVKLQHAFLHGLQWSCGDLNVHLKGRAEVEKMEDRAVKRGLIDPGTLLINELDDLDEEKNVIAMFGIKQRELHLGPRERLAIEQGEDVMPGQLGRLNLEEYIHYE